MKEYIDYITIKYYPKTFIQTSFASSNELNNTSFNSAIELNDIDDTTYLNEKISGKITTWGGETENYNLEKNTVEFSGNNTDEPRIENLKINTINTGLNNKKIYDDISINGLNELKILSNPVKYNPISNIDDYLTISINKEITNQLKVLNNNIFDGFRIKLLSNNNLVLENGVWYTYVFTKYVGFGKGIIPNESELLEYGISKNTSILLLDNINGATYVNDYKKVKLISDYIISDVSNKQKFLNEIIDDKKYLQEDTDSLFLELKKDTLKITNGLNDSTKIKKIYDYILSNISYSKVFDINNKNIFSGIYTYKNNEGVCSGYAKLYLYMLSIAGIEDLSLIKGHVIDAPDFPNIGHTWIQIGNDYYDPTFDDPIGNTRTKSIDEYKYFGLPKDLFYVNRFNYGTLPNELKNGNLETRKNYILNELDKLKIKYSDNKYNLLKPLVFKDKYGFDINEKITIDKLKNILPSYDVYDFKYLENDKEIIINDMDYYTVSDSNIESTFEKIGYNIDGLKLFKWDNGTYRLAYNLY